MPSYYTKSEWILIKINKLKNIKYIKCLSCKKSISNIHFHHCEYRSDDIKDTQLKDLVLLCNSCHTLLHSFYNIGLLSSYDIRIKGILKEFKVLLDKLGLLDLPEKYKQNNLEYKKILLDKLNSQLPKKKCS